MDKAFTILNEMTRAGLIRAYAVGGAVAAMYYFEPILTYDLDIFFIPAREGIDVLAPLYAYLKDKGYGPDKEHILIGGIPVQLIPVYNNLVREAVENARETEYKGVSVRILAAEYLIAISLQTNRPKDRERLAIFLEESRIDHPRLEGILKAHGLYEKFKKLRERHDRDD